MLWAILGPSLRKAKKRVIFNSGNSFKTPEKSRSNPLPRASLRTTSLKLSPSFLTCASATYASSDRVIVFTVVSPWMSANVCQPSRPLDESHYIQAGHRPTPGVRSLPRTPAEVPAAPRARRGGTEGETRRRGDDHPARRPSRPRSPPGRADETRRRPLVRAGGPSGWTPSGPGPDDARDRAPRDERGSRHRPRGSRRDPRTHASARAGQQARSPRRPGPGTGDGPPRSDLRARDGVRLLGPPPGSAGGSREGDRHDDPRGGERALVHLRRTAHLGIHVPDPRRAPRL